MTIPREPDRSNVELKARLAGLDAARQIARQLPARDAGLLDQIDTYFCARRGRLKLRVINQESAELIWYFRPDCEDAATSRYTLVPVPKWDLMRDTLAGALGVDCQVKKRRELFLWENVRIHLDQVDGLGSFLEFEAVMSVGGEERQEQEKVQFLRQQFHISDADLVAVSYSDLIR